MKNLIQMDLVALDATELEEVQGGYGRKCITIDITGPLTGPFSKPLILIHAIL